MGMYIIIQSNSTLEFLISRALKNTGFAKLYVHIKERFDNSSCYETFKKLTGKLFLGCLSTNVGK